MSGKVVAIIGPARCGKSYLTKKLSEHYGAPAYFEGEESGFPREIVEDLRDNVRPLERFLYFRNRSALNLLQALKDAEAHPYVFLDTCWLTNRPWVDVYSATQLEKELLRGICDVDTEIQPWPSAVIYLTADVPTSRKLMASSGRSFDADFDAQMLHSKEIFGAYVAGLPDKAPVIELDRSGLDLDNPEHLKIVTDKIDAALSTH